MLNVGSEGKPCEREMISMEARKGRVWMLCARNMTLIEIYARMGIARILLRLSTF